MVQISWYEGLENFMCTVQSSDAVLSGFFTVREWSFVRAIFEAVVSEADVHLDDRGFVFKGDSVEIYTPEGETSLGKQLFFSLVDRLYNVLIDGANEDHHNVRFEPWWQAFIETAFILQQRCKAAALMEEEKIMTLHLSQKEKS